MGVVQLKHAGVICVQDSCYLVHKHTCYDVYSCNVAVGNPSYWSVLEYMPLTEWNSGTTQKLPIWC